MIYPAIHSNSALITAAETSSWLPEDRLREQWKSDGLVVLTELISPDVIDAHNSVVDTLRAMRARHWPKNDSDGRLGQLHQTHRELMSLAFTTPVQRFLRWFLNDDPVLFGSLHFERGSQQTPHIDAISFWPDPINALAGVWIALEDVDSEAGPFFYIPGSHTWRFESSQRIVTTRPSLATRRLVARTEPLDSEERRLTIMELEKTWQLELSEFALKQSVPSLPLLLKNGEIAIFHPLLVHGGLPVRRRDRTRKSAVFHFLGRNARVYSRDQFLLWDSSELPHLPPQKRRVASIR